MKVKFWEIPRDWPGATVVVLGGGASLTSSQVETVQAAHAAGDCKAIAINDAYRVAPWADLLYFCDNKWWEWHREALKGWAKPIVRLESVGHDFGDPRIKVLKNYGEGGLVDVRDGVMHGANSGYQATHLAIHRGATRIVLLGIDMHCRERERPHWFGHHPDRVVPDYARQRALFATIKAPAERLGVEIVNCTPGTALDCFRRADLAETLQQLRRAQAA